MTTIKSQKASRKGSRSTKPVQVAIGFRVKSGRAIAVLLAGSAASPEVLDRREIPLCDPAVPDSMQPYHAALEMTGRMATNTIDRLVRVVQRATSASVGELVKEWGGAGPEAGAGCEIRGAGLVVGSLNDPAAIRNDHIRAHALEGQLFRVAVEDALRPNGLTSVAIPERDVYSRAVAALSLPEDELKQSVTELGRAIAGPWRADEKTAALAAWMMLRSGG